MRCSIALLTIIITAVSSSPASACCLTDWLFGRKSSPYAVGYAPYGYSAGYVPVAAPYTANYPVATTSVLRPTWNRGTPVLGNGAFQAQRPTYYNNPSVYTGLPVTGAYQANRIPVATNFRGNAASPGGYLGASNRYPSTYTSGFGSYASSYGAAQVPATTAAGLPLSAATPIAPLFAPTVPRQGGLARFFGSTFGTNYRSSYYRAPITYYRPATTVDPVSGTTVTVQQPCTSYVQQLQRTPYSSPQGPYAYGTQVPSAVGQASATAPVGQGQFTVPIPSTVPTTPGGYYGQGGYAPNTAPLTGSPSTGASQQAPGDHAPLDQPEIRNRPPAIRNGYGPQPVPKESDQSKPKSYWKLQEAEDSTAMIRETGRPQYSAQPIHAPEDYVSPFRHQLESKTTPVSREAFEAPQLPARSYDSVEASQRSNGDSNWVSTQVREASTGNRSKARRVAPKPVARDTSWKPARR